MQDESIMAYGLTAFAGAIIAWAYYICSIFNSLIM